jgi:hypothetical protein
MKKLSFLILALSFTISIASGQIAIATDSLTPDASSAIEVKSVSKGVLIPRMTQTQRLAIPVTSNSKGLLVYDNTSLSFWFYNGTQWVEVKDKFTTVGMIMAFPTTSLPDGWLKLDGSSIAKASYPGLEAIYPAWVSGANIILPDYRGYYLRGSGTNSASATIAGNTVNDTQAFSTRLPRNTAIATDSSGEHNNHSVTSVSTYGHSHTFTDRANGTTAVTLSGLGNLLYADNSATGRTTSSDGAHSHTVTFSSDGAHTHTITGGGDAETRPYSIGVVWAVRVKP